MDKMKKFKKEALVVEVDIAEDYYPGDPKYIGREDDKKTNEFLIKSSKENNIEIPDLGGPFHYYPMYISESQMESYYNDALFSIPNMSLDSLTFTLKELEAYSYNELYKALDVLSSRFANEEIMCRDAIYDVKRFKNIYKRQFKNQLHICGRVTPYFVGCLRRELKLRNKYLDMLTGKVKDAIDIILENTKKITQLTTVANTDSKTLKDNAMKIDFDLIFYNAADYADDPDEMKEYIVREYKKAEKEFYYEKESFCKGVLKIAAAERDSTRLRLYDQSEVTDTYIYIGGGIRYTYEEIDLIEQIINDLRSEEDPSKADQFDSSKNNKYAHLTALQWGAIIHYTHEKTLRLKKETVDNVIATFREMHDIKLKESSMRNKYYEAVRKITETFNYKSVDLEKTIPFFIKNYNYLTEHIRNEIIYHKQNEEERDDNQ